MVSVLNAVVDYGMFVVVITGINSNKKKIIIPTVVFPHLIPSPPQKMPFQREKVTYHIQNPGQVMTGKKTHIQKIWL